MNVCGRKGAEWARTKGDADVRIALLQVGRLMPWERDVRLELPPVEDICP